MDLLHELTSLTLPDAATLSALALLDATSLGTLVIPLILLLLTGSQQSARAVCGRVLIYLGVLALFYWLLGAALLSGLQPAVTALAPHLEMRTMGLIMVVSGGLLVLLSWWSDPARQPRTGTAPERKGRRWAARAERAIGSGPGLVALALTAGALEAATMLPYLAAISGLSASELSRPAGIVVLGAYCAVMILPALGLVGLRLGLGEQAAAPLGRLRAWGLRTAPSAASWGAGIVGVVLIVHGAGRLNGAG